MNELSEYVLEKTSVVNKNIVKTLDSEGGDKDNYLECSYFYLKRKVMSDTTTIETYYFYKDPNGYFQFQSVNNAVGDTGIKMPLLGDYCTYSIRPNSVSSTYSNYIPTIYDFEIDDNTIPPEIVQIGLMYFLHIHKGTKSVTIMAKKPE